MPTLAENDTLPASLPHRHHAVLAQAMRGLSWPLLGACVAFVALQTLFAWPIATGPGRGLGPGQIAEVYARLFTADILRYAAALAGIVAWNLLPAPTAWRGAIAALAATLASWLLYVATFPIDGPVYAGWFDRNIVRFSAWLSYYWVFTLLATFIVIAIGREADAADLVARERAQALELERGLSEARLQVSQAQIEPHFLFNTLANIRRLYAVDPAAGSAMSRHFATMLASALPAMRDTRSTLGRELAYAMAYLEVQQIRMGPRLAWRVDVPAGLREAGFPPLMLATLVENAIKHGLAPLEEGGSVGIEAAAADGALRVRVLDTGRGLQLSSGTGVGLANIESRLAATFGTCARLALDPNEPRGVIASITIPLEVPAEAPA